MKYLHVRSIWNVESVEKSNYTTDLFCVQKKHEFHETNSVYGDLQIKHFKFKENF